MNIISEDMKDSYISIIIISEDILVKIYEFPFLIRKGNLILRVGGGNQIPFPSVT